MKTPEPGAKRYFFIPSTDGTRWELAEATFRRRAWEVAYPGLDERDHMQAVPPKGSDWVEMVPPGREPRAPWPEPRHLLAPPPKPRPPKARPAAAPAAPESPEARPRPAVPRKAVPGMSRELEDLLLQELKSQKVPDGKSQCPLCGVILEPTRTKRIRTHDHPLKGTRCEASGQKWSDWQRPPRPRRA